MLVYSVAAPAIMSNRERRRTVVAITVNQIDQRGTISATEEEPIRDGQTRISARPSRRHQGKEVQDDTKQSPFSNGSLTVNKGLGLSGELDRPDINTDVDTGPGLSLISSAPILRRIGYASPDADVDTEADATRYYWYSYQNGTNKTSHKRYPFQYSHQHGHSVSSTECHRFRRVDRFSWLITVVLSCFTISTFSAVPCQSWIPPSQLQRPTRSKVSQSTVAWLVAESTTESPNGKSQEGHHIHTIPCDAEDVGKRLLHEYQEKTQIKGSHFSRREALQHSMSILGAMTLAAASSSQPAIAATDSSYQDSTLTHLQVGQGSWQSLSDWKEEEVNGQSFFGESTDNNEIPPEFCTYGARILLNYDPAAQQWWANQTNDKVNFALLAATLARTWKKSLQSSKEVQALYNQYLMQYTDTGNTDGRRDDNEFLRQINLWFAMLPPDLQPEKWRTVADIQKYDTRAIDGTSARKHPFNDFEALLPFEYHVKFEGNQNTARIQPPLPTNQEQEDDDGITNNFVLTVFGPLASPSTSILTREQPFYGPRVYALLGLAGATGCALTHSVVIPLDVVKTRAQTDTSGRNLLQQARRLVDRQGISSLFLGAQATVAGYLWYGASVYPSYTFCKRWLTSNVATAFQSSPPLLNPDVIALVAGAMAAVVASLGLTPLESARIRAVANPRRYAEPGVVGTLQVLADEKALYSGLTSLLTRQVIFGSVKFLAFERFAEAITATWPSTLGTPESSWLVSLLAGGMSGAVSAFVSQPADSLLTYVASKNRQGDKNEFSLMQGLGQLWEEEGAGALWRGLGSRSVWAGSIIAGQFFLYDIFRTAAGVSSADLTQVWNYQLNL